jgi:hypothetical protein
VYAFERVKSHMMALYQTSQTRKHSILTHSVRAVRDDERGEDVEIIDRLYARDTRDMTEVVATRQLLRQIVAAWPLLSEDEQQAVRDALNFVKKWRGQGYDKTRSHTEWCRLRRAQRIFLAGPELQGGLRKRLVSDGRRLSRDQRREKAAQLRAEGNTYTAIASRLGVGLNTVRRDLGFHA